MIVDRPHSASATNDATTAHTVNNPTYSSMTCQFISYPLHVRIIWEVS